MRNEYDANRALKAASLVANPPRHVIFTTYKGEKFVFNENEHWAAFAELGRGQTKTTVWCDGLKPA